MAAIRDQKDEDSLPDPYRVTKEPIIGPSPVPVMEQVFWVELDVAPETPAKVIPPPGITLLDKTKPGKGHARTRLYCRSDRGIENGAITIDIAGRGAMQVPLRILTYRQDIEEKIKVVPGIEPSVRKDGRSYYTDDMIALAQANIKKYPHLGEGIKRSTAYKQMTDEQIFASLPSWNVPRQCYSNWPCPHCGEKIYQTSGYYPWKRSREYLFKSQCPLCEGVFPTNDFAEDDFTSGEFPDDGWGWDPGTGNRSDFAGWVAYYNHHMLWQGFGNDIHRLALRYLLCGDEESAHKVGVLLSRMAYVYCGMDMRWQQIRTRYLRRGRLLVDGNWERNGILVPVCRAYDAIFDHIDKDASLVEFLQKKDPVIKSPDDVKALIETYLIQVFGWDWLRRELSGGNAGAREEDLAQFAVCANMGQVSDRWIEELFTHAYNSGANRGGFDDEILINTMTREGPCWISALGYAYDYVRSKSDMAEILSRVDSQRWKARCNLYNSQLYPKFRAEFDTWIDILVAGQFAPNYGDSGGALGAKYPKGIPAELRTPYERAYRRWPTDKLARAIYGPGKATPDLFEPDIWSQVEAQAKEAGPEPPLESRVMDGVGFVFLESRAHAEDIDKRAGIALRYGYGYGHHHQDNLNIEMFAKGLCIAPELGYPTWAHPMGNTSHVAHHNTGMVDRATQYKGRIARGDLEMFAAAPEASFADVSAQPDGFPNRMYRRAVCLADAPGGNVYLVDILRLAGGNTRTYCFHGPPHDDFQSNLEFGPVGTSPLEVKGFGGAYANNIVEAQFADADGDVWGDWKYQDKHVRMRVNFIGQSGRCYYTAKCAKTDLPPIRYLFAEDEKDDGASEFIALWQPYEDKPFIEKIERLFVEGAEPGEFQPVALRVTLVGGQEDTFLYSHHPDVLLRCGELEFKGSFGYWSEVAGKLRFLHLVNGGCLRKGNQGIADAPPPFRAKITAADYTANTIALDRKLPDADDLKGRLIYMRCGHHRTAYHIAELLPPGDILKLDLKPIIYRSQMMSVGSDKRHIVGEIIPPIEAARGFKPGYYDGALLTGEDLKARYRVTRVEGDKIYLDRPVDEADFPDVDGDGRRMVSMYDMGSGDEVTMYRSVFMKTN